MKLNIILPLCIIQILRYKNPFNPILPVINEQKKKSVSYLKSVYKSDVGLSFSLLIFFIIYLKKKKNNPVIYALWTATISLWFSSHNRSVYDDIMALKSHTWRTFFDF